MNNYSFGAGSPGCQKKSGDSMASKQRAKSNRVDVLEKHHLVQTYARYNLTIARGKGCWVWDTSGKKYLDLLSGLAVNALGYSHPRLVKAIREQAGVLIHTSNLFYHEFQAPLAEALKRATGMDRVFFCNSGAEANEGALKMARVHGGKISKTKYEVVALENSFHGRTFGALAATGQPKYQEPFEPLVPGFKFAKLNDIASLQGAVNENTCAILLEPIQGEGGIFEIEKSFAQAAAELARRHNALLIFDEIQTGFGRTGDFLASKKYGVKPDIVVLAKPMAGGLPLGSFQAREQVAQHFVPGMHGTTFGGGPLTCRVALEFMAVLQDEKILQNVRSMGAYFVKKLQQLRKKHSMIRDVRGRGLMLAIDLDRPSKPIVVRALERGLILNSTHDTVIRLLPPLIIDRKLVDLGCQMLDELLTEAAADPV
jgi:predicted acetylornithine/succinylornithine family transaminase